MFFELYGMITKICEDDVVCVCDPIFKRISKNKQTKFFRREDGKFVETSIRKYGNPIRLQPSLETKINTEKEYLILFNDDQNCTKKESRKYTGIPVIRNKENDDFFYIPAEISVGIKFPDKLICVMKDNLDAEELRKHIE